MSLRYHSTSVAAFQSFVPGSNIPAQKLRKLGNFEDYNVNESEHEMYAPLCRELDAVVSLATSRFTFKDIAHWAENNHTDHRPDLALYPTHRKAATSYTLSEANIKKSAASVARKPYIARCAYQWMVMGIEVKNDTAESGFGFKPDDPLLRTAEKAVNARSQFATYAAEIMLRQHRTHLYMVYVAGWYVRIFRWDRNGAIVSHPIDLRTDSKQLFNFVYRLSRASKAVQGFDPTVALATIPEINKLRAHVPGNKYLEEYKRLILESTDDYPIYKVECDEVLQAEGHRKTRASRKKRFLLGKHVAGGYAPVGRGTKGWVAYCVDDDTMVFFKEQWRANAVGVHPEIETYLRLQKHKVNHVATVIAGGDVRGEKGLHKTLSQRYFDKEGIDMHERIQTRLVLREVGRPLESYADSIDLILVVGAALQGHQEAWEKAGVLHRDVSIGNILIDTASDPGEPIGFLSDWDLCKYREELEAGNGPSQTAGVSGTWAFGSALSLMYPKKPKDLTDDLESFVYIPLYCALRYHKHSRSPDNAEQLKYASKAKQAEANGKNSRLTALKHSIFYEEIQKGDIYIGGENKFDKIKLGAPPITFGDSMAGTPLDNLLKAAYLILKKHYLKVNHDEMKKYLPDTSESAKPSPPADRQIQTVTRQTVDLSKIFCGRKLATLNAARTPPRISPPTSGRSASSASASGSSSNNQSPLATHTVLLDLFQGLLMDKDGVSIDLTPYRDDKLFDQFDGNCVIVEEKTANDSGETNDGKKTGDGKKAGDGKKKKRKSRESDDSNPRPTKYRQPRTQNHGYQVNFDKS